MQIFTTGTFARIEWITKGWSNSSTGTILETNGNHLIFGIEEIKYKIPYDNIKLYEPIEV
jgi:hypothetical protein